MSFASEFKQFAMKGNVVDLAVGVIIGAAFAKIVDSVVADLIMPIIGRVVGGLDFSSYYLPLAGAPTHSETTTPPQPDPGGDMRGYQATFQIN